MANTLIQLKFSTVASNVPSSLANGEIAINSADGKLFYSSPSGSVTYLNASYPAGLTTEVQFNDAGSLGSNSGFTFAKSSQLLTVTGSANIGGMNVVPTITSAYAFANTVNIKTDAAFTKANNALANTTGTFAGTLSVTETFRSLQSSGDEGGQIDLATAATNQSLVGGFVNIDIFQNRLRIFESGGTNRGAYIDLANGASAGVGTNILAPSSSTDGYARTTANAAFDKANSANVLAQAAFDKANSEPIGSGAFTKANSANILAQAAFDSANISSGTYATSAFAKANSANVLAQSAFDNSNTKFASAGGTISGNVTLTGNLIPTTDNVFYIGSSTNRWRSIFVGANSIDVGGIVISNSGGSASLTGAKDFSLPDSPIPSLGALSNTANAAFAQANTANVTAEASYARANTVNIFTQAAFTKANTANTTAEASYAWANTINVFTQSAYAKANAANILAQAAFDNSNTKFASAGGTITGNVTISSGQSLTVTGNLIVQGTTVSLNTASLDVVDTLITLGTGNYTTDILDIGFAGHYNAGTNAHTGLIRDAVNKEWYFFKGYTPELNSNNNINLSDASFSTDNVNANYFKGNLNGTTVTTNTITANVITVGTGIGGNVSGITFIYANNFIANTGGYFQFPDGSKQYTANATSTIGQNAYDKANSANIIAQAAFDKANSEPIGSGAFTKANSANILAQAAYDFANTANIKVDSSYAFANTINIKTDSAYAFANTINIKVDSAYAFANTVNIKTDAAFTKANAANVLAQAAFNAANSAGSVLSQAAFDKANSANVLAQASFDFANTINVEVDSAYAFANTVNIKTDSAYAWANTINIKVDSAYTQANAANVLAQAAFNAANSAGGGSSQAAFDKANSANVLAQASFDKANSSNILAQAAFNTANAAGGGVSQAAFDKANSANVLAQAAFNQANTGGGGGASISISDSAPTSPTANSLWWQSNTGVLKIYYSSQWVDAAPSSSSTETLSPFLLMGA